MPIKQLDALDEKFHGHLGSSKWTLCVGAGISRGIVPTWQELTRRLVNETFATTFTDGEFSKFLSESAWSLDSWIQACSNHYQITGKTSWQFFELIEKHLYFDLRAKAESLGIEDILVGVLDRPRTSSRKDVARVCEFFETQYSDCSLLSVVRVIVKCRDREKLPEAIVSFNADTLLHTLVELYERNEHYKLPPPHSHPKYMFRPVLRPLGSPTSGIPIYHCHGAIKPLAKSPRTPPKDSRDRLVFLESEYISVATNAATWSETLFMFYAQTTRMMLLGFSMSDPNMRRWLALSNKSALQDLEAMSSKKEMTPRHVWLTTAPKNAEVKTLKNEALIHLGVRPGWISSWTQVEAAFENLLALR